MKNVNKMEKTTKNRIILFCSLSFVLLAVMSIIYYVTRADMVLTLCMFTPAISAFFTRIFTKEGVKELYIKPYFKKCFKWYIFVWVCTPFVAYFGALVYFIIFPRDFSALNSYFAASAEATTTREYILLLLQTLPLAVLINPIMGLLQCFGEELAWRGYLLPKLSKKYSPLTATVLTGVIWGLWHAPIIAMGYNYGSEHPVLGILAMIILCVVLGMISGFLFFKTKSVWASVIFHAAVNGIDLYTPADLFMEKQSNAFVGPNLTGIIGGIGFIIVAFICVWGIKKIKSFN